MNFNLKLKKIRTFRKMTQKELSEKIGLTDQHRIVQYEKGVRVPKKDLVDKMAQALDVNPYTLYDTAMTVIGDILVVQTMKKTGFTIEEYSKRHHGGYLGEKSRSLCEK